MLIKRHNVDYPNIGTQERGTHSGNVPNIRCVACLLLKHKRKLQSFQLGKYSKIWNTINSVHGAGYNWWTQKLLFLHPFRFTSIFCSDSYVLRVYVLDNCCTDSTTNTNHIRRCIILKMSGCAGTGEKRENHLASKVIYCPMETE